MNALPILKIEITTSRYGREPTKVYAPEKCKQYRLLCGASGEGHQKCPKDIYSSAQKVSTEGTNPEIGGGPPPRPPPIPPPTADEDPAGNQEVRQSIIAFLLRYGRMAWCALYDKSDALAIAFGLCAIAGAIRGSVRGRDGEGPPLTSVLDRAVGVGTQAVGVGTQAVAVSNKAVALRNRALSGAKKSSVMAGMTVAIGALGAQSRGTTFGVVLGALVFVFGSLV